MTSMPLDVELLVAGPKVVVVALIGRLTLGTPLSGVEAKLRSLAQKSGGPVVLDLSKVEYADSAGLGVLVYLYGQLRQQNRPLRLIDPNSRLTELFQLTNTARFFEIYPDRQSALANLPSEKSITVSNLNQTARYR
jgi:anti-sigma B factor antagonist